MSDVASGTPPDPPLDPLHRLTPVVRLAPAKLNLTLAIIGRRADGFHSLHSVILPLALADRLSLAVVASGGDVLRVDGFAVGVPDPDNLVLRAIAAARKEVRRAGVPAPPLAARLDKRIPVAAGLGGGSSDAAAALDGALEAWGAALDDATRLTVAAGLGSDVPFFLAGGAALVEGRGERVTPLRGIVGDQPGVLVVTPPFPLATADVFAAFGAGYGGAPPAPGPTRLSSEHLAAELRAGLRATDLVARAGVLASANDLSAAAAVVAPPLTTFRRALVRLLGRPVGLSGSGPSLWALYPSGASAENAANEVRAAVVDGRLPEVGSGPPFVAATTTATRASPTDDDRRHG
jgi:4-diphosphocytidyl-2-C-methyl-D-erythritol kinase